MTARMQKIGLIAGGLALHLALLSLPALVIQKGLVQFCDLAAVLFLLGASLFCVCDLTTISYSGNDLPQTPSSGDRRARQLALATGVVLLAIFWIAIGQHLISTPPAARWHLLAGGLLMVGGSSLRWAAIRTLGKHFRTEVMPLRDQLLIESGIYRYVRHPSETGLLAVSLGACILLASPMAIVVWLAVLLPLVTLRIRLEERHLELSYGAQFERYRCRVKGLLPFLY